MKLHTDPHYNAPIKPRGKRTGKRGWFGVEIETEPIDSRTTECALLRLLPDESKAGFWAVSSTLSPPLYQSCSVLSNRYMMRCLMRAILANTTAATNAGYMFTLAA